MATRKKTDRAAAEAWLSEPVTVRLFRDNGSYKEDKVVTVTANTASSMTVDAAVTAEDNAIIYPGEAGAQGRDVYVTLVLGADGYGTTEITGGGLEHIVKQLGSAGTGDPLNQRASVGWKATKVAVRLDDSAIRRIETCSTYTE